MIIRVQEAVERMQLENDSPESPVLPPSPSSDHSAMQTVVHSGSTRVSAWSGGTLRPPSDIRLGSTSCPDLGRASRLQHQNRRPHSEWEVTRRSSDMRPAGLRGGPGVWSANLSVTRETSVWSQAGRRDTIHVSNPHLSRRDLRKMSDLAVGERDLPAGHARCLRRPSRSPREASRTPPASAPARPRGPDPEAARSREPDAAVAWPREPDAAAVRPREPDAAAALSREPDPAAARSREPDPALDEDVPQLVLSPRPPLARHASDTRLLTARAAEVPPAHAADMARVVDHLYVGTAAAAQNQWLLCRLSVVAVVELDETESRGAPPACPCVCPRHLTHHSLQRLRISVRDHPDEDLRPFLAQINRFIGAHRRRGGGVLVHSAAGCSRAPTVVLQYLMQAEGLSLMAACERLSRCWPSAQPNQGFFRQLVELDSQRRVVSAPPAVAQQAGRGTARRAWY